MSETEKPKINDKMRIYAIFPPKENVKYVPMSQGVITVHSVRWPFTEMFTLLYDKANNQIYELVDYDGLHFYVDKHTYEEFKNRDFIWHPHKLLEKELNKANRVANLYRY